MFIIIIYCQLYVFVITHVTIITYFLTYLLTSVLTYFLTYLLTYVRTNERTNERPFIQTVLVSLMTFRFHIFVYFLYFYVYNTCIGRGRSNLLNFCLIPIALCCNKNYVQIKSNQMERKNNKIIAQRSKERKKE